MFVLASLSVRLYPLAVFFFHDTATTEIYTLSLHDALPISARTCRPIPCPPPRAASLSPRRSSSCRDRKSTRLNSSHVKISYAVFCLKKKRYFKSDSKPDYVLYNASTSQTANWYMNNNVYVS